jgi:hypothetical protein
MSLILGLLFLAAAACSFPATRQSEAKAAASEPTILHDKVESIPLLDARLTKLVFFGSGPEDITPLKNPIYKNRFQHAATTRVHPEIHLDYAPPGRRVYFTATVHIRENGRTFRIVDYEGRIEPDWSSSYHSVGIGVFGPGNWRVGTYDVDVHINGEKMATGAFEIY